ncbi:hypothetical protein JCM11641_003760 [Rhodosporidiobolus odoratus]
MVAPPDTNSVATSSDPPPETLPSTALDVWADFTAIRAAVLDPEQADSPVPFPGLAPLFLLLLQDQHARSFMQRRIWFSDDGGLHWVLDQFEPGFFAHASDELTSGELRLPPSLSPLYASVLPSPEHFFLREPGFVSRLYTATRGELQDRVFNLIMPHLPKLLLHRFGKYLHYDIVRCGRLVDLRHLLGIIASDLLMFVGNENSAHAVQEAIAKAAPEDLSILVPALLEHVDELANHPQGSRFIQKVFRRARAVDIIGAFVAAALATTPAGLPRVHVWVTGERSTYVFQLALELAALDDQQMMVTQVRRSLALFGAQESRFKQMRSLHARCSYYEKNVFFRSDPDAPDRRSSPETSIPPSDQHRSKRRRSEVPELAPAASSQPPPQFPPPLTQSPPPFPPRLTPPSSTSASAPPFPRPSQRRASPVSPSVRRSQKARIRETKETAKRRGVQRQR